jgi:hypothetical protein
MSPPQVIGLVHSVQTRLKNQAQESGRPFAELLELYAIERARCASQWAQGLGLQIPAGLFPPGQRAQ